LTDEQVLICGHPSVAFPLHVPVRLAVTPPTDLRSGLNVFQVQAQLAVDVVTVDNAWFAGVREVRVDAAMASIAASLGNIALAPVVIEESPVPCTLQIERGTSVAFTLPKTEATWELDGSSTLEVTIADVQELLEAIDITVELFASGPQSNCAWETEAPTVRFAAP
jgi:hypothetical protein